MKAPDLFSAASSVTSRVEPSRDATRQARTPIADDGRGHVCRVCGRTAGWGFGVFLRRGFEGRWSCADHRDEVEAMTQ